MKRLKFLLFFLFVLAVWATAATAQSGQKKKKTTQAKAGKQAQAPPAQLAYYPDFYAFYDPARGYVYWQDSAWQVSRERPAFMKEAQKGRVRIELLHDRTIGTYPEDNFERYMKLYPPQNVTPTTPVPILTITREHK